MDYLDGLERERSVESGVKAIPEAKVARLARPAGPSRPIAGLTFASVRTALEVGRADGPEELAADHRAARTVAALRAAAGAVQPEGLAAGPGALQSAPLVAQRRATAAPSRDVAGGGPATASVQSLVGNASQTGRPLERGVRSSFEAAMGADFGAVRVHTGPAVAAGSASIAAKAFTVGSDIFFRDGLPDTAGAAGQHLMAHELAHTLERPGGIVGRLRRTPDATGEEISVERINDPGTTKATLEAWADLLEWDDEACADAIEVRLAEFALQESDAAERVAAQSLLDKAKAAADEKDEAERATSAASALRHKTVADLVGGSLPNYVETIDGALKVALK
ncbi:MAG: hypothetical protein JWN20_2587, partial [Jatrophihabitantaceae bacterium]|nr:hypothetical protein [Jatrophihabitantaceae bacterium]